MHFPALVVYSLAIAVLFAIFMRDGTRERVRFAAYLAGAMIGIAVAVGWAMYFVR